MHVLRLAAVLVVLAVLAGGCVQGEDDFYQYRTVTYSVSVVGPYDTFDVWYTAGDDFREEQPESPKWRTTVKGKFYETTGLEIRADAYLAEEQSLPVVADISCEIAVDGTVYERNTYSHTAVCKVDFDEVKTPPESAPAESAGSGSSYLALWLGAGVVTAAALARWAYVRRRKSRGSWPPAYRG